MKTNRRLFTIWTILAWLMPLRLNLTDDGGGGGGGGGDPGAGGGGAPSGGIDTTSHVSDADALWNGSGAPADDGGGGGGGDAAKPEGGEKQPAAGAKPAESKASKLPETLFGQKKPEAKAPEGEKKPEKLTVDLDAIDLHGNASSQTKEHFKTVKTYARQLEQEKAALAAEMEALRKQGSTSTSPEVEKLRAEHKALSDRLSVLDLQNHPEFVRQYVEPKNKGVESLNKILAENQITDVDVAGLLSKPRAEFAKAVSEIAGKLNDFDADEFKAGMRELSKLDAAAKAQLANAGELAKGLKAQGEQRQRQALEETWKELSALDGLAVELPTDHAATPEERAQVDEYNAAARGIRAEAEKIATGALDEKGIARVASEAATLRFLLNHGFPKMNAAYQGALGLIKELEAEISALKGQTPNPSGGEGGAGGGEGDNGPADHYEAAAQVWGR